MDQYHIQARVSTGLHGRPVPKQEQLNDPLPDPEHVADESAGSRSFESVTVVAKHVEEGIGWGLLNKHERLMAQAEEGIEANRIKRADLYNNEADIGSGTFVEEVKTPRGQVCCTINDINNNIHPNAVAAKYGVSVLVLIPTVARFAQLEVVETTPEGELPELFD